MLLVSECLNDNASCIDIYMNVSVIEISDHDVLIKAHIIVLLMYVDYICYVLILLTEL